MEEAWDAAAGAGLVLMEAYMYRHHPQAAKARALVDDGAIGRLRAIRSTFSFQLRDLSNIRMLAELDGGALMDVGCYCVSGSRLLGGRAGARLRRAGARPDGRRRRLPRHAALSERRDRPVRRVVLAPEAAAPRGGGRGGDARRRGAVAGRLGRPRARERRGRSGRRGGLVPARAGELRGGGRRRAPSRCSAGRTHSRRRARSTRSTAPPRRARPSTTA